LSGVAAIVGLLGCLDAFGAANPRAVLMAGTTNSVDQRLRAILTWIDQHAAEEIALSDAAAQADMHPQAFARYFRKATGHSFVGYLGHVRVRNACQLLPDRARSVTAIALDVGFGTVANFNRTFRRLRRMTPSAYRSRSSA
jgi:transcriptional regulator GlxA family with amidase domain